MFIVWVTFALLVSPAAAAATDRLTLRVGGTTSQTVKVGEPVKLTAHFVHCTDENVASTCSGVQGKTVEIKLSGSQGTAQDQTFLTDFNGDASLTTASLAAGSYTGSAFGPGVFSGTVVVTVEKAASTPTASPTEGGATPNPTGGNGGGPSTAAPVVIQNIVPQVEQITKQAETATGLGSDLLFIVLAVIVIVLLAIIATALLVRRR